MGRDDLRSSDTSDSGGFLLLRLSGETTSFPSYLRKGLLWYACNHSGHCSFFVTLVGITGFVYCFERRFEHLIVVNAGTHCFVMLA